MKLKEVRVGMLVKVYRQKAIKELGDNDYRGEEGKVVAIHLSSEYPVEVELETSITPNLGFKAYELKRVNEPKKAKR